MTHSFALVCFLTTVLVSAQGQTLKDYVAKGERAFEKGDYETALKNFQEALIQDPDNADINYKTGISYFQGKDKSKSAGYLEKAFQLKPDVSQDIDYYLGMAYQYNYQYARAVVHYTAFKIRNKNLSAMTNQKIRECTLGDSIMQQPANAVIENLGSGINSIFSDESPLLSPDGETMIFTSNRASDEFQIKSKTNFEDIFIARKQGEKWSTPENAGAVLNTKYHDAAVSLTPDGKTLFLHYENGEGDLYTSDFDNGSWSKPLPLNKFINHPSYREGSACISADGGKLYFTSNRPGGRGGFDIYVSQLDAKGQWGRPSNLGPTINTKGNEESPFIHNDGVTLYFSSNGHPGLGDNDVFKSENKDGKWTRPQNLGFPVNSREHDGYFTISPDNTVGYYSGVREGGIGGSDLYLIRFLDRQKNKMQPVADAGNSARIRGASQSVRTVTDVTSDEDKQPVPEKTNTRLTGRVIDVRTSKPLTAAISLVDNKTNKKLATITTAPNGEFELTIPHGGNYGVTTEKSGYLFNSINFNLPEIAPHQKLTTEIVLEKIEVGSKVILKNVFFDVGKADLKNESIGELETILNLLSQNASLRLQVNGHTDNTGHEATNLVLSLKRAESVITYLMSHGIPRDRLEAKGYGSTNPVVSNDDETGGRQINRRTEIEVIN